MAQALPLRRSSRVKKSRVQFSPSEIEVERKLNEILQTPVSSQTSQRSALRQTSSRSSRTRESSIPDETTEHATLLEVQRDKLQLELELLTLKAQIAGQHLQEQQEGTPPKKSQSKKKVIDWPQEFVPGASTSEFEKLEVTDFTAGFLVMIKPYDSQSKEVMLQFLELLMIKAMSYTWRSVRGFYQHVARQVELCRLDFEDHAAIRELATTFFKHSDLRGSQAQHNTNREQRPTSTPSSGDIKQKSCRQWNYTGSCSCDTTATAYAGHHRCRVCAKTHPMLH